MAKEEKPKKKIKYQAQTKGITILYTGEGKGKTTAALGLVLRAVGYKKKVLIVQFGKVWFTGELEGVKKLKPFVTMVQGGKGFINIFDDNLPFEEHVKAAQETYTYLYNEVTSDKYDLVMADEIVGAIAGNLIKQEQVEKLIKDKPERLDLVITGHHAKKTLINKVDLATEMIPLKHPYEKGFLAKEGVDY